MVVCDIVSVQFNVPICSSPADISNVSNNVNSNSSFSCKFGVGVRIQLRPGERVDATIRNPNSTFQVHLQLNRTTPSFVSFPLKWNGFFYNTYEGYDAEMGCMLNMGVISQRKISVSCFLICYILLSIYPNFICGKRRIEVHNSLLKYTRRVSDTSCTFYLRFIFLGGK
jgi:hypothetical protein